ncbi:slc-25A46, partial [Pristionchus pacificus]|uniref:Solute carrier family 25 member 46 n=1 Tax=Pristionchus pacificus TaxID=54126 RepID=A0A8R1V203_PRIPA
FIYSVCGDCVAKYSPSYHGLPEMSFITNRSKLPNYNTSPQQRRRDLLYEPHGMAGDLIGPGSSNAAAPYLNPSPPLIPANNEDPLAGLLLGVSQMVTKLAIVHPCGVIRRQCQVHQNARSLHLTPFTLVPVTYNMTSQHGISTLWRGSIGNGVVWGLSSVTEVILSDLFGLPRTFVENGSASKYWKHILLKASTYFLMTPFYISSFIETIRSGKGLVAADDNRLMEVVTKGFDRMKYLFFGPRDHSRKFSLFHLALPTVFFHTSHYVIHAALYSKLHRIARDYINRKAPSEKTKMHELIPHLFATMTSTVLTDLILFPIETVMHRLYVQGTRTLIDNMDTGIMTISMKIKYDGFFHCLKSIIQTEGCWALYAGVGAVMLEYGLQSLLHQVIRACFERGTEGMRKAIGGAVRAGDVTPPLMREVNERPLSPIQGTLPAAGPSIMSSPPRNATQYPSFGELSASDPLAQFAAQSSKSPLYLQTTRDSFNHQFME